MKITTKSAIGMVFNALLLSGPAWSQPCCPPRVTGITNAYSFTLAGLSNYAIAQGSIFVIYGQQLADAVTELQNSPLPTSLAGTTVSVSAGGVQRQASLYYVTPTQVAAIMPSAIPSGTAQVTLANRNFTATPVPVTVVPSAFGILTLSNGTGPAAAFDLQSHLLNAANAANPGDTIVLFGTGAGPVKDDSQQAAVTTSLSVYIGGQTSQILYQGRSQYPGLDQLNVVVPAGVSGCYVSVVVQAERIVSNYSSIPVAPGGRQCFDPALGVGISSDQIQSLANKTIINTAILGIGNTTTPNAYVEVGLANFLRVVVAAPYDAYVAPNANNDVASLGSCTVRPVPPANSSSGSSAPFSLWPVPTVAASAFLNSGPAVAIIGPYGSRSMSYQNGGYVSVLGENSAAPFIPVGGGVFTFDNLGGSTDVAPFRVQANLSSVAWLNKRTIDRINRSQDVTITWSGGNAGETVNISGHSTVPGSTTAVTFNCVATATAHQFHVPPAVLLALPPSGNNPGNTSQASLTVTTAPAATLLPLPGFDLAFAYAGSSVTIPVTYE